MLKNQYMPNKGYHTMTGVMSPDEAAAAASRATRDAVRAAEAAATAAKTMDTVAKNARAAARHDAELAEILGPKFGNFVKNSVGLAENISEAATVTADIAQAAARLALAVKARELFIRIHCD